MIFSMRSKQKTFPESTIHVAFLAIRLHIHRPYFWNSHSLLSAHLINIHWGKLQQSTERCGGGYISCPTDAESQSKTKKRCDLAHQLDIMPVFSKQMLSVICLKHLRSKLKQPAIQVKQQQAERSWEQRSENWRTMWMATEESYPEMVHMRVSR